jgi:hypothetical protein
VAPAGKNALARTYHFQVPLKTALIDENAG